jgi:polyisoprenoid-binding protein YceI
MKHPAQYLALLALVMTASPLAHSTEWTLIPEESRLIFRPTWEGVAFEGEFRRFHANLDFDSQALESARINVSVDVTSADAGGDDLNEGMALPEWFDFARYPQAVYRAEQIRATADGYVANGTLELKGTVRDLSLPFTWERSGDEGRFEARLTLNRTDWGIGSGEWAGDDGIGLAVELDVQATFRRRTVPE